MRIAIDARAYNWEGIGRYTRNIINGLIDHRQHQYIVLLSEEGLKEFKKNKALVEAPHISVSIVDGKYYSWREQTIFWRQLQRVRADLTHFTHFNIPIFYHRPFVVTIHDVTRFIFPGQHQQTLWQQMAYEFVFKRAVERARSIITVSDYTRNELFNLPLSIRCPVNTIYEGVDDSFRRQVTRSSQQKVRMLLGTQNPYLLFVGVWMSHKNLERIIRAYADVVQRQPNLNLVITGRPKPGYSLVFELTRKLGIEKNVIFPGFVPSTLLPALYAEAACFVFPSLYEGFGLPALEAASCGTPVITSNVTSLPEIMGDASMYVNPEYVPSIVRGIDETLVNNAAHRKLIAAGKKRAQQFNWQDTVRRHLVVYEKCNVINSAIES